MPLDNRLWRFMLAAALLIIIPILILAFIANNNNPGAVISIFCNALFWASSSKPHRS